MAYRMVDIYIPNLGMHVIKKGFSARYGVKAARRKNTAETCEQQKRVNAALADERRMLLILNNFKTRGRRERGDRFITLTYRREVRPGFEQADKNLCVFLKKIKRKYKNARYIAKTENTKRGAVHHHILISRDVPHDFIADLWEYSNNVRDEEVYSLDDFKLARYFVKNEGSHEVTECKYHQSRNLEKPIRKVKILPRKSWRREPVPKKGYEIAHVSNYFDVLGFEAQRYVMIRKE